MQTYFSAWLNWWNTERPPNQVLMMYPRYSTQTWDFVAGYVKNQTGIWARTVSHWWCV